MACGLVSETSHILIIMQRAGRGWCGNEREGEGSGRGGGARGNKRVAYHSASLFLRNGVGGWGWRWGTVFEAAGPQHHRSQRTQVKLQQPASSWSLQLVTGRLTPTQPRRPVKPGSAKHTDTSVSHKYTTDSLAMTRVTLRPKRRGENEME